MNRRRWLLVLSFIAIGMIIPLALLYYGVLHINHPDPERYPIIGVDVSSYQGEIDWESLAEQNISFAFIKATEGSSLIDGCFETNWMNASKTNLRIGAYHFFSFESPGEAQADLFINTVSPVDGMLPPVIDVEYYGGYRSERAINLSAVKSELRILIDRITAAYSIKPIIYTSKEGYDTIVGDDEDCDLWIRSVYSEVRADINWTFWQYSNRHILEGYCGKEEFIDLNVFCGTADDFAVYPY